MHGGDIYRNKIEVDYSINVNPLACPLSVKDAIKKAADHIEIYPDPQYEKLYKALEERLKVSRDSLLLLNGASEFISLIVHLRNCKKGLLLAPSFIGYKRALDSLAADISYFMLDEKDDFLLTEEKNIKLCEKIRKERPDIIFITNPNNPNGGLIEREKMLKIAKASKKAGSILVIDECFLDLNKKSSDYTMLGFINDFNDLAILNAYTKTYGVAGLRLGYAAVSKNLRDIKKSLPEWNISTMAYEAGLCIEEDNNGEISKYLDKSLNLIEEERQYLTKSLAEIKGIEPFLSETNYILFKTKIDLYKILLKKMILIRDCSDYEGLNKGFYRIAVKTHEENEKLMGVLKEIYGKFI